MQHLEYREVATSNTVTEKRLALDLQAIRDEVVLGDVLSEVVWTDTKSQLADSMTKFKEAKQLYKTLESGLIQLGKASSNKSGIKPTDAQKDLLIKIQTAKACYGEVAVEAYFSKNENQRILDCVIDNLTNYTQNKI